MFKIQNKWNFFMSGAKCKHYARYSKIRTFVVMCIFFAPPHRRYYICTTFKWSSFIVLHATYSTVLSARPLVLPRGFTSLTLTPSLNSFGAFGSYWKLNFMTKIVRRILLLLYTERKNLAYEKRPLNYSILSLECPTYREYTGKILRMKNGL